MYVHFWCAN